MILTIDDQIKATLNKIRPFLHREGGDVEYLGFEDGIVKVRMMGACVGCAQIDNTISGTVEFLLLDEVPGVVGVQVVE
jgi:Fe-S cluster biogenesis protein NfuA